MNKIELLAPAGSLASLKAAVINGADAVYLGLSEFSARSKADNFNLTQLKEAIDYAHYFDVRVYVAINTLLKDDEIEAALDMVEKASSFGVDAFILQDIGFLVRFKEKFPNIQVHASTQMGIHNYYGALAARDLGINRVILSREVTISDIKQIKENVENIEIECFVHGALCVSFSGNCYFSSLVSLYSGNRGKCLQLCRKKYSLNSKNGYYLSPKDLCLIKEIGKLIDAGVSSFKIEGRMRKPEYVGEIVRIYRKAIDYELNKNNEKVSSSDISNLKKMFNRGNYCTAHLNNATDNVIYPHIQNHMGLNVGQVLKTSDGLAYLDCELHEGDGVKFLRNNKEVGHALVSKQGTVTSYVGQVKLGDSVHLTTDNKLINDISLRIRKILLNCSAEFLCGKKPKLSCCLENGFNLFVLGDEVIVRAEKSTTSFEQVSKALQFSDEIFEMKFNLSLEDGLFVPTSQIKSLRRALLVKIKEHLLLNANKRIKAYETGIMSDIIPKIAKKSDSFFKNSKTFVQINEYADLNQDSINKCDYIILSPKLFSLETVSSFVCKYKQKAILNLPNLARGEDIAILKNILKNSGIKSVVVNNIFGLKLCEDMNVILGSFFNQLNDVIKITKIISIESEVLSHNNINFIYGYAPLMTFAHCVKKSLLGNCEVNCKGYEDYSITDEMNNKFKLSRYKLAYCYGRLINCVPTYIKCDNNIKRFIDLTMDSSSDLNKLLNDILDNNLVLEKFTRGNINKILK